MDLKPVEFGSLTRDSLEEQTVLRYMDKAPLLHLSQISFDGEFEGIAYCSKSYINRDLYDDSKWSGTFHLIDGDGVKFTAYFYGMEQKFEQHQGPAYVKGVRQFKANNSGREVIVYRLNSITQSTIDCPKSLFLKHLEGYNEIINTFNKNLALIKTPEYDMIIEDANKLLMIDTIKQETLGDTYGTQIGARADAFNKGCIIMNTLAPKGIDIELCYLAFLLKLWKPEVEIDGITLDSRLNSELMLHKIIYTSKLNKLDMIKLIDCIDNTGISLEGHLVNNVLETITNMAYQESKLKNSMTEKLGLLN